MAEARALRVISRLEYASLGRVGERELRGVVERRELRLGPVTLGRARARAIDVYQPGGGRRSVAIQAPPDPHRRALRWTLLLLGGAWVVGALARRRHTPK